jgi:rubredoxin
MTNVFDGPPDDRRQPKRRHREADEAFECPECGDLHLADYHRAPDKREGEQVFYASKNAGTISGVDAMEEKPEDCADESTAIGPLADEGMISALVPEPMFEHPQQHPNESTPPEEAVGAASAPEQTLVELVLRTNDANGGIVGGALAQGWGEGWAPTDSTRDQLPGGVSLPDICSQSEGMAGQWMQRPLGPDNK